LNLALLAIAFGVGALIGAVGVGGILLVAALATIGELDIHEAAATALFTFIFTGVTGTILFQRKGSIDWRLTVPLCAGAVFFGFLGAWANSMIAAAPLALILAAVIIFAGVYTLASWHGAPRTAYDGRPRAQQALLGGVGAVSGFGSGLTGVGGPALSVPIMVLFGFPVLATIGASQVIQIIAAISGTLANLNFGTINFHLVLPLTVLELGGVLVGASLAHIVNQAVLRRFVGILCVPVGVFLAAQAIGWI
jgi:uncharacterized membrane protein YfcA